MDKYFLLKFKYLPEISSKIAYDFHHAGRDHFIFLLKSERHISCNDNIR